MGKASTATFQIVTVGAILIAVSVWMFGPHRVADPTFQSAIDPTTNKPLEMGVLTYSGDFRADPLGRTPADCVPLGYDLAPDGRHLIHGLTGDTVTFADIPEPSGGQAPLAGCFSNGVRLVPIPVDQIPDPFRRTPEGLIDWVTTTPAERAAEAAREEVDEVTLIIAAAQQREAIARAAAPTLVPDSSVTLGCEHLRETRRGLFRFAIGTPGCHEVVLGPNQFYDTVRTEEALLNRAMCTYSYPRVRDVELQDRPGPDRLVNTSRTTAQVVVYWIDQGATDPISNKRCGA
jgi:hypothetical protein